MTNNLFSDSLLKLRYRYRLAKRTEPNYLDALHAGQRLIAEHLARFKVLDCGRKWGKTDFAGILYDHLMKQGKWVASVAPSYKTTQAIWDVLMRLNPDRRGVNSTTMSIHLPGGGKYRGWSLDNTAADSIRPFEYDYLIVDEAAFVDELYNKWTRILLPTLAKRQGKAIFMSSPQGFNDFWKLFQMGMDANEADWMAWRIATTDPEYGNPFIDPAEIELQRRLLPERTYRQEFEGAFEEDAGAVYDNFTADNITLNAEYNPAWRVSWGVDDGYVFGDGPGSRNYHPRVILLGQFTPIGGLNIFYEYVRCGELSEVSISEVLALPYPRPEKAYVDSSAAELIARLQETNIYTIPATHRVNEGIKNVRRLIRDGQGVCLLQIHPRCVNLTASLQKYRYDTRSSSAEPVPLKVDENEADGVRYLCFGLM